jgi:hypothetical protein
VQTDSLLLSRVTGRFCRSWERRGWVGATRNTEPERERAPSLAPRHDSLTISAWVEGWGEGTMRVDTAPHPNPLPMLCRCQFDLAWGEGGLGWAVSWVAHCGSHTAHPAHLHPARHFPPYSSPMDPRQLNPSFRPGGDPPPTRTTNPPRLDNNPAAHSVRPSPSRGRTG